MGIPSCAATAAHEAIRASVPWCAFDNDVESLARESEANDPAVVRRQAKGATTIRGFSSIHLARSGPAPKITFGPIGQSMRLATGAQAPSQYYAICAWPRASAG